MFNLANKRNSIASITSEGIQKKLNALQKLTAELQNCPLDEAPLKRAASILQLQTLQAKLGSANEQLRIMQQEVQTAGTRADSMSAKAQEGASRNDALRKQITFYQTELASLKKSYIVASRKQARSKQAAHDEALESGLQGQRSTLEVAHRKALAAQNKTHSKALEAAQTAAADRERDTGKLLQQKLQAKLDTCQTQLQQTTANHKQALSNLQSCTAEKKELSMQGTALRAGVATAEAKLASQTKSHELSKQQLLDMVSTLRSQNANATDANDALRVQLAEAKSKTQTLALQVQSLQKKLVKQTACASALEQKETIRQNLQAEVDACNKQKEAERQAKEYANKNNAMLVTTNTKLKRAAKPSGPPATTTSLRQSWQQRQTPTS